MTAHGSICRTKPFLYTKLTDEDYSLSLRKLQVLPLLSECLLSLYTRFEEAGISPNVTFQSEGFHVNADEDALKRVFLNLPIWLPRPISSSCRQREESPARSRIWAIRSRAKSRMKNSMMIPNPERRSAGEAIWSWPWTAARSLCRLCAAY